MLLERIGFLSRAAVTKTVVELDPAAAGGGDWAINGRRLSVERDAGCDRIRDTAREAWGSGEEARELAEAYLATGVPTPTPREVLSDEQE